MEEEGELLHASSVGDGDISWENDSMNMNIPLPLPLNMGEGVSIMPSHMHIVEEEETYRGDLIPSHDLSLDVDVDDASLKSFLMFQESPALNESPEIRPEDDDQADLPLAKKRRTDVVPEPHISIINPASSLDFMNFAASILEDPQTKQQPQQIPNNNNNTATTATTVIPETTTNSQPLSDKDDYSTEPNVDEEARARYEDKRRRNRESAFKSRKRKNDAIQDLGARVELLEKQLAAAHEENAQLRTLLARAAAAALGGADANTTKSEGAGKSTTCQAPEERQANTTPAVRLPLPWVALTLFLPLLAASPLSEQHQLQQKVQRREQQQQLLQQPPAIVSRRLRAFRARRDLPWRQAVACGVG